MRSREPSNLDPENWIEYRASAHRLLDACIDRLEQHDSLPWRPMTNAAKTAIQLDRKLNSYDELAEHFVEHVLPFATGNTHPRFFGWVHGTGLASGLMAELVAATMNSNSGGRDHGAIYVEREVIRWCLDRFGFPMQGSGILVNGTSQATLNALACARTRALGNASRIIGLRASPQLVAYAALGTHNAIAKALEVLGIGSANLRLIANNNGHIDTDALGEAIRRDRSEGKIPFCVVATAGSVDGGSYDDFHTVANVCSSEGVWLHVDGAFGAWLVLADMPWRILVDGLERADSLAFDFHKWMFVQYSVGAVLIRDEAIHRATFAARPDYLAPQDAGLGGGDPWYCDYGVDLSRGFLALRVWTALKHSGEAGIGRAITRCCALAQQMAHMIENSPILQLAAAVHSNVVCFGVKDRDDSGEVNARIGIALQDSGEAVFSTTKIDGRTVLRAAIVNHRTTAQDVVFAISAVERLARAV